MAGEEWWLGLHSSKPPERMLMEESKHAELEQMQDGRFIVTKLKDKRTRIHIDYHNALEHYGAINAAAERRSKIDVHKLTKIGYGDW